MQFLNNKTSLIIWIIVFVILFLFFLGFLFMRGLELSYPQLSSEANQLVEKMDLLKYDIGQIGNQQGRWEGVNFKRNYDGVNCEASSNLKTDCDFIKNITGEKPVIVSIADKFCAYIKYDKGFYRSTSKYWCKDTNNDSTGGICDGKTFYCVESKPTKTIDMETIILLISFILSAIVSIALFVRLLFVSRSASVIMMIILVIVFFIFFFTIGGRLF